MIGLILDRAHGSVRDQAQFVTVLPGSGSWESLSGVGAWLVPFLGQEVGSMGTSEFGEKSDDASL